MIPRPPRSTRFPFTTLFRSQPVVPGGVHHGADPVELVERQRQRLLDEHGLAGLQRPAGQLGMGAMAGDGDRKSTRLNSSHANISDAVFWLKKKKEGNKYKHK